MYWRSISPRWAGDSDLDSRVQMKSSAARPAARLCISLFFALVSVTMIPLTLPAQTNFAILTGNGAWTWYNDPRSLFHNGILYFGYVRTDGRSVLSTFNTQTGAKVDL